MGPPLDNDPLAKRVNASRSFVSNLRGRDRAAVVDFDEDSGYSKSGLYTSLTPAGRDEKKQELNNTLEYLSDDTGATYLGGGIREANEEYRRNGNSSHQNVVVALTDGANSQGWVHFEGKYVYSCPFGGCTDQDDWIWLHEWGYGGRDAPKEWVCVSERRGDSDCEEWDDNGGYFGNGEPQYYEDQSRGWRIGDSTESTEPGLNNRTLYQTDVAADMGTRIYTVLLDGDGSTNPTLLKEMSDRTGGKYYETTKPGELEKIFNRAYDDASQAQPISKSVNETFRMDINITDFPGNGNVTVLANDTVTGDLDWRMRVTNLSSSHPSPNHVVIDDGNNVVQKHDYSSLGGTPLELAVMDDSINGNNRNLSASLFNSGGFHNITLDYSPSVANLTYDFRVDSGSNVSTGGCDSPPCISQDRQRVGSIHDANFTISYQNENIDYDEPIELEVNPVETEVETGASPVTSPDASTNRLEFSTPVYEYKTYYPFDQDGTDGWPDQQAYDASQNGNTMGLEPDSPDINSPGAEKDIYSLSGDRSYDFDDDEYVRDLDGWNNIPTNGSDSQMFTISMWFRGTGDGVLLDASGPGRPFRIEVDNGEVIWEYSDEDGDVATTKADIDPGTGVPGFAPPPTGDWHHITAVGGWNNNKSQLFVIDEDGVEVSDDGTEIGGKPMQETAGSTGLGPLYIGGNPSDGFDGRIDEVRIYHKDMSDLSVSSTTGTTSPIDQTFEPGASNLSEWSVTDGAGISSDTSNSGSYSAYTQGHVDYDPGEGRIFSPEVDLSGDTAELQYWVDQGADPPEYDDDLFVEYTSSNFAGWKTLERLDPDTTAVPQIRTVTIPDDGIDDDFRLRIRNPYAESDGYDYWHIDDVVVTTEETSTSITGDPGFIDEINNDTAKGNITTDWQNFTDGGGITPDPVFAGGLKLQNVDAELNGGDVSVWVQQDTDDDGNTERESDEIELDGSGSYDVGGSYSGDLENGYRFRLKIKVDHPDTTDAPKFYDAELVG
jgi:hypothetical protein